MYLKLSPEIVAMFVAWKFACLEAVETIDQHAGGNAIYEQTLKDLQKIALELDELLDAEKKATRFVHENQLSLGEPILSRKQAD